MMGRASPTFYDKIQYLAKIVIFFELWVVFGRKFSFFLERKLLVNLTVNIFFNLEDISVCRSLFGGCCTLGIGRIAGWFRHRCSGDSSMRCGDSSCALIRQIGWLMPYRCGTSRGSLWWHRAAALQAVESFARLLSRLSGHGMPCPYCLIRCYLLTVVCW